MRRAVYLLGVVAPVYFALGVFILGASSPGYSHIYQTISELGERGSPTAREAALLFISTGIMVTVFGYGLHSALRRPSRRVWCGVLVMLYGLLDFIGSGLFPVGSGGRADTPASAVHVYATVVGELVALAMPAWFTRDTEGQPQWEGHRGLSRNTFYAGILLSGFLLYCIAGHTPGVADTPMGLAQRLLVGLFLGWITATALRLLAREQAMGNNC